jgi:hypothetical protein
VLDGFFQGKFDDEATALALFEAHNVVETMRMVEP